jgi:catechol 2,3-dioxygenase-like lactoylglutathione lyase family enzyme
MNRGFSEGPAAMIIGFDHTSFTVGDIERGVRFWTEVMGFTAAPIADRDGGWQARMTGVAGARLRVAHLHGHGQHLELIQYLGQPDAVAGYPPDRPGAAHVCFMVSDIRAVVDRILAAGGAAQGEIAEVARPGVQTCLAVYVRDPNGILVELVQALG